jgi:hypothetical protein
VTIKELDPLIGSWEITGRSDNQDSDNISGAATIRPVLDGTVLEMAGSLSIGDHTIESVEMIWHDKETGDFPAHVYSPLGAPSDYRWRRSGSTLTHAGNGATFTGTISDDGRTITGAWEPDPGTPRNPVTAYASVMRRTD